MNIAIDMSPLTSGHFLQHRVRGTGFYLENLKRALLQYYPKNSYTFFTRGQELPKNVDLVHYPYFEPFFLTLPLFPEKKSVVTVHDLTPLVFPKHFKVGIKGKVKWQIQKQALKSADAIIVDSICSKNDVIKHAGINPSKINVVYLAAGHEFKVHPDSIGTKFKIETIRKKYNLPEKFVLYVGDVTWNKNLPGLIKAIQKINVSLVMVGKALLDKTSDRTNPWNKDLVEVEKLVSNDKKIIRVGFVSQEDLILLYNEATVFTMPSIYEGFGLPILEAMSCGCPVVASKEGSIPEIAGDASLTVDAYSIDSIAKGISQVFNNKDLQKDLSQKGLKQAKKFTWEKTTYETIKVYENAIHP